MFAIYNSSGVGANRGGPSGYLFQLQCGLKETEYDIDFLTEFTQSPMVTRETNKKKNSLEFVENVRSILHFYKLGIKIKRTTNNQIEKYSVLHVHSSEDVYYLRRILKYKGKIILTSHKPETLAEEKIGALNLKFNTQWKCNLLRAFFNMIEKKGYAYSDAFIFPSIHAEEIYKSFPGYKKYSNKKPVEYVYTGCEKKDINLSREKYREKIGIAQDDFVVSYIGRHNYIKGYDLLCEIGEELVKKGIEIVCAGTLSAIKYPETVHWHELGYISDVQNLINASDVVVIPNRNTYFDLAIIEIMSEGKIVVTSNTGGNIDIAEYTKGLVLFEAGNKQSLLNAICLIKNMKKKDRLNLENQNYSFYLNNCKVNIFAQKYIEIVNNVLSQMGETIINVK